ncbi:MAG: outer membrane beta-barrel protein [Candidatus Schekmanbacteria bacterium]|nr:outer membrane beta-barrel protein [Candidatus Schekmanbacteria bacterium]
MRRIFFCAAFLLLITATIAQAVELGDKFSITPSVTVQEVYDSNIFKQKNNTTDSNLNGVPDFKELFGDDKMSDYLTIYALKLDLDYPFKKHRLNFEANKDFIRFSHYDDQNYENESLSTDLFLNLGMGFNFNPRYLYKNRVISRQNNSGRPNDFLEQNTIELNAGYEAGNWKFVLGGNQTEYEYDIRTSLSRDVKNYKATLTYMFSDINQWYLKYNRRKFMFDTTAAANDNHEDDILLGASMVFGGDNLLKMEAGHRWKTFGHASGRDFGSLVGNIKLSHQFSDLSMVTLSYERLTEVSYFRNATYYVENSVNLDFVWQITSKISNNWNLGYSLYDYKETTGVSATEYLEYFKAGTGLNYAPHENIQLSLSYEYSLRDANLDLRKFDAHQVVAGFSISWK